MAEPGGVHIGMLTPSSNTVVEPLVARMLSDLPEVAAFASRLPVTAISLEAASQNQFNLDSMLAAGELLADAKVDVMGWNGTSASWLGFHHDERLCAALHDRFGVATTTAVLAVNELLGALGCRRIALVTPYIDDIQERILAQYSASGFDCVAERHTGEEVNYAFARIPDEVIERLILDVAKQEPDGIVVMCTNMRAAHLVEGIEKATGIPVIDSLAAYLWKALMLGGVDTTRVRGWGRIFSSRGMAG